MKAQCGQHCAVGHRGVLPFESTIPSAHVVHGLPCEKSCGGFGGAQRSTGGDPHLDEQEGLAFLETGTFDVEARVRRLKWAQTLLQNPAHHVQLIAALFGRLPAEQQSTLGVSGEITPEANPCVARWVADLRELEPFDERGVVQRMGCDVRAFFFDRELTAGFIAMDVTILRLRSLSVPQWGSQEVVGHPTELSEERVPQWRCCVTRRRQGDGLSDPRSWP